MSDVNDNKMHNVHDKAEKKGWWAERFPVATFGYEVPAHANTFLFSLGGITLVSVAILIVTGILLAQYYTPNPELANQSLRILMTEVKLGSFIRGLHVWAAEIAVISVLLHLLRVLFYGSYKKPREVNWLIGVVLFVLMIGLFFTGTVLRWDQEAYEALAHTEAIGQLFGGPIANFLSDGFSSVPLLTRFFNLHVSLLPIILAALIVIHLFLIKTLKISSLPYVSKKQLDPTRKHTFFHHFYKLIGYGFIVLGVIFLLALFFPPELGPAPVKGVEATRPAWLFMGIFSVENWAGIPGLIIASAVIVLLLAVFPFIDRGPSQMFKDRKSGVTLAAIIILILIGLTANAYATKPKQHIGMGGEGEPAAMNDGMTEQTPATDSNNAANQGSMQDGMASSPVVKGIDDSLNLVTQIKAAVANKDGATASAKTEDLDKTIDPVKKDILTKDASLKNALSAEAIGDAIKASDFAKATTLLDDMQKALEKAKGLFAVAAAPNPMSQKIDGVMAIVSQVKTTVANKDGAGASAKTEDLDKAIDPIKKDILAKDASLKNSLSAEAIGDAIKASDFAKATTLLDDMQKALEKAKGLFAVAAAPNPMSQKIDGVMAIVSQVKATVANKDGVGASAKTEDLDKAIDPIKKDILAKDASLKSALSAEAIGDAIKASDFAKATTLLDDMQKALEKAKGLFA